MRPIQILESLSLAQGQAAKLQALRLLQLSCAQVVIAYVDEFLAVVFKLLSHLFKWVLLLSRGKI